jgi:hypothetical protein
MYIRLFLEFFNCNLWTLLHNTKLPLLQCNHMPQLPDRILSFNRHLWTLLHIQFWVSCLQHNQLPFMFLWVLHCSQPYLSIMFNPSLLNLHIKWQFLPHMFKPLLYVIALLVLILLKHGLWLPGVFGFKQVFVLQKWVLFGHWRLLILLKFGSRVSGLLQFGLPSLQIQLLPKPELRELSWML